MLRECLVVSVGDVGIDALYDRILFNDIFREDEGKVS